MNKREFAYVTLVDFAHVHLFQTTTSENCRHWESTVYSVRLDKVATPDVSHTKIQVVHLHVSILIYTVPLKVNEKVGHLKFGTIALRQHHRICNLAFRVLVIVGALEDIHRFRTSPANRSVKCTPSETQDVDNAA